MSGSSSQGQSRALRPEFGQTSSSWFFLSPAVPDTLLLLLPEPERDNRHPPVGILAPRTLPRLAEPGDTYWLQSNLYSCTGGHATVLAGEAPFKVLGGGGLI